MTKLLLLIALTTVSFSVRAEEWSADVLEAMKKEVAEESAHIADLHMTKLLALAEAKKLVLSAKQKALAFEVFFGIEQEKEYRQFSAHVARLGAPPKKPIVIWVNTEIRAGNTTLMPLIAQVLGDPYRHYHMYGAEEYTSDIRQFRKDLAEGKTLILDEFARFYRSVMPGYFARLIADVDSNAVILAVNDLPIVDASKEWRSTLSYVTPAIETDECDLTLTELFRAHHQPTTSTLH